MTFRKLKVLKSINAFFPADVRSEKRIYTIRKYLKSLEEIFPEVSAPSLETDIIADPDWGEQWKKYFKPIRVCKNIVVKPTWERYAPESRDIVVEIDPGMAFGTGQHASTRMCMEAIEDIIMKDRSITDWKVLDVGCGTGILGITAAKMGAQDVVCVDNDPKATEIAAENAVINSVADRLHILKEDAMRNQGTAQSDHCEPDGKIAAEDARTSGQAPDARRLHDYFRNH